MRAAPSGVLRSLGTCVREGTKATGRTAAPTPKQPGNGLPMGDRLQWMLQPQREQQFGCRCQTVEPNEDQTSILRLTRSTTSLVKSVVPW
jgi:hypothetical protein